MRIGLAVLPLTTSIASFALDLPYDPFELNYEEFLEESGVELNDGRVEKSGYFSYFNHRIEYIVSFDKREPSDVYMFFSRNSTETEAFVEFFRDFVLEATRDAALIETEFHHELKESQPLILVRRPGFRTALIYQKLSSDSGFRGFGITFRNERTDNLSEAGIVGSWWEINREIRDIAAFDPSELVFPASYLSFEFINSDVVFRQDDVVQVDGRSVGHTITRFVGTTPAIAISVEAEPVASLENWHVFLGGARTLSLSEIQRSGEVIIDYVPDIMPVSLRELPFEGSLPDFMLSIRAVTE